MNFSNIKQAMELKRKADAIQKELGKLIIEAEAGHGTVKVKVNGQQKVLSVEIAPEALDPSKQKYLEKLLVEGLNEAFNKAQKEAAKQLKDVLDDLKLPGM